MFYAVHRIPDPLTGGESYPEYAHLIIECEEPQQAVTPGQVVALWDGDWCLGSGVIESTS